MKPVWQKEKHWLGADGVQAKEDAKIRARAGLKRVPRSLEEFLANPYWAGSEVTREGNRVRVLHPSGTAAYLTITDWFPEKLLPKLEVVK